MQLLIDFEDKLPVLSRFMAAQTSSAPSRLEKLCFEFPAFFHLTNIDVTSCFSRQFFRPLYEDKSQKIARSKFWFIWPLRIIQEYFQPKIGRKIRIFSLDRKNNILIKKKSVPLKSLRWHKKTNNIWILFFLLTLLTHDIFKITREMPPFRKCWFNLTPSCTKFCDCTVNRNTTVLNYQMQYLP